MKLTFQVKIIGVFQIENRFFVRVHLGQDEIELPITAKQFHEMKLTNGVLTLEIEQ